VQCATRTNTISTTKPLLVASIIALNGGIPHPVAEATIPAMPGGDRHRVECASVLSAGAADGAARLWASTQKFVP
jgi:hypothetical protein